jgi:hypothetical protein
MTDKIQIYSPITFNECSIFWGANGTILVGEAEGESLKIAKDVQVSTSRLLRSNGVLPDTT